MSNLRDKLTDEEWDDLEKRVEESKNKKMGEVRSKIEKYLSEEHGVDKIEYEGTQEDLSDDVCLDSLDRIELICFCEDEWNLKSLTDDQIEDIHTLPQLIKHVEDYKKDV